MWKRPVAAALIVVVAALGAVVVLAWGLFLAGTGMDMSVPRTGEQTADAGSLGRLLARRPAWEVPVIAASALLQGMFFYLYVHSYPIN